MSVPFSDYMKATAACTAPMVVNNVSQAPSSRSLAPCRASSSALLSHALKFPTYSPGREVSRYVPLTLALLSRAQRSARGRDKEGGRGGVRVGSPSHPF